MRAIEALAESPDVTPVLVKGVVGMTGVATGVGISLASAIQVLQAISLIVGIGVGVATIWSILRKNSKQ